jgi:lysophospholipase L1-like esterase
VRGQLIFPDGPTIGVEDYFIEYEIEPEDIYGMPYFLQKLNKSLLLLLPWITSNIHNLLTKNSHLFHIGFIITLVRFLEDTMLGSDDGDIKQEGEARLTKESVRTGAKGATAPPSLLEKLSNPQQKNDPIRALVIGDSLAVGTGCLEVFDPLKDNSAPMIFVENTTPPKQHKVSKLQPPVFPQILARTLSYCFRQPVHWRSGGVDGGDVNDIRKFCMDIIKQECAAASVVAPRKLGTTYISGAPDIIVVLFGMNDLKNLVSLNLIQVFRRGEDEDGEELLVTFGAGWKCSSMISERTRRMPTLSSHSYQFRLSTKIA